MTNQQISSIARQVLAVLVTVYGILSATQQSLHLPVAVSSVLVAFGPVMLSLEHFLSDPSTGTSPPVVPGPTPVPDPAPTPAAEATALMAMGTLPAPTTSAPSVAAVTQYPTSPPAAVQVPAPVPPPEWSTMAAVPPQVQAPPAPNPAPPAPGA